MSHKVFGIGFHKTATTSLGKALEMLGYSTCRSVGVFDAEIESKVLELTLPIVEKYDAFYDNPWPIIYRELDQHFPDSKFVLTTRPVDQWYKSALRHFGGSTTPMRDWIYGSGDPQGRRSTFIERYERHNREVRNYFASRESDFLELRITEGEGWSKLCSFLEKSVPQQAFPHEGKAAYWDELKAEHGEGWIKSAH